MNKEESSTDLGKIRIHKNVISSVAAIAAHEVDGVRAVGRGMRSELLDILGRKENGANIKVEFDKNGDVSLDIPLVVRYGFNIPEVSAKVQENVRNALDRMTNLSVRDINVNVQGIEKG